MGEIYHSLAMMYYCYYKHDWALIVSESHARMENEKRELKGKQESSASEMQNLINS
jgi:hypothetical protein